MTKDRDLIDDKYKWNVADIYPTPQDWANAKDNAVRQINTIGDYAGTLGNSSADLLRFLQFDTELDKDLTRLSVYAHLISDENVGDASALARKKELEQVIIDYQQVSAFVRPELAAIPDETLLRFLSEEKELAPFTMLIDRVIRGKAHTLSDTEEALYAKIAILGDTPSTAFDIFSDAEMPHPTITLHNGEEVELDAPTFAQVRASANKDDRHKAVKAFWENYAKFQGTFGELMNGNIRQTLFATKARKYESCLQMALYSNKIPVEVYKSLIDNVNKNLPSFHRYLDLKRRLLNLDQLDYADLYAPAVAEVDLKYSYEEAQDLVLQALEPLGDEYRQVVRRAFDERWIDVFPSKGKASGAYSNGAAYDVHPYILMNFNERYDSVGTLIHELGHTMQSYYSNKKQPYAMADYAIFVAEVASTFNEALLDNHMLKTLSDKKQKISLLMNMLDGFKGTLFRQTQFAEFELAMYEAAEQGVPITGEFLSKTYGEITRKYYGDADNVCHVPHLIDIEWAYIPHFYSRFYVYQYSTSFVASQALAEMVLSGDMKAKSRYMDFLAAGDSKYPIELLKDAGVDMTSSEPFDKAIAKMNKLMDEIELLMLQ